MRLIEGRELGLPDVALGPNPRSGEKECDAGGA